MINKQIKLIMVNNHKNSEYRLNETPRLRSGVTGERGVTVIVIPSVNEESRLLC